MLTYGMLIGYTIMLIALSAVFVGIKRYRDADLGGVIGFRRALALGLCISFVAGILYVIAWETACAIAGIDFATSYAAAMIALVDLVITIDTSIANLAGAMGKPTWVLLPFSTDWRWMLGRADSPWYPTARLFRQPKPDDWESVVDEVVQALQDFPAAPSG